MSEYRKPTAAFTIRNAKEGGKKTTESCKLIEIFKAELFKSKWGPSSSLVSPKIPLHSGSRREMIDTLYRVRIDGKWYRNEAKYTLLTQGQIIDKWIRW